MAALSRTIPSPIEAVFGILVDPHTYPEWLVGAKEIRAVDPGWPAVGTQFHHRVGLFGPLTVADGTRSLAVEPPHRLVLEARFRPLGRAQVTFELEDAGYVTRVRMEEHPIGPLGAVGALLEPLIAARNKHSLDALATLARNLVPADVPADVEP
jgi:uncharacterized protein YndB with AHSA1/START domain